jgi:hypothetical protein
LPGRERSTSRCDLLQSSIDTHCDDLFSTASYTSRAILKKPSPGKNATLLDSFYFWLLMAGKGPASNSSPAGVRGPAGTINMLAHGKAKKQALPHNL